MTWPPSPWVILAAWVLGSLCLAALWCIAILAARRYHERRRPVAPVVRISDWLNEALKDWPGPELDVEIAERRELIRQRLIGERSA